MAFDFKKEYKEFYMPKNKDFKEIDTSLNTITNISMKIIKKINEKTKSLENSKDSVLANNTIEI